MVDFSNPAAIFSFLTSQSYAIIFILMIIEGPIVTAIASAAASLGYLNLYIILTLSFLGNIVPDLLLFFLGKFGRKKLIISILGKFGLNSKHINLLEKAMEKHGGKTLVLSKLTPPFPIPGIILAGFTNVPFKKFLTIDIIFNLVSTAIAAALGFYFGLAASKFLGYIKIGEYAILLLIPIGIIFYIIYRKIYLKLRESINSKEEILK